MATLRLRLRNDHDAPAAASAGRWRGDAQVKEETPVPCGARIERGDDGRIAGGFAPEGVLACGQMDEWMEEEQALGQGGRAAEPQVATLHVSELVAERHLLLSLGKLHEPPRRQQDRRTPQAGDERCLDLI